MADTQPQRRSDGTGLIDVDPWLEPYADQLRIRYQRYQQQLEKICDAEGTIEEFALGHEFFGFNRGEHKGQPGVWYREWAPGASALSLVGDFNDWDRTAVRMERDERGIWEVFLSDQVYGDRLTHGSRVKVHVEGALGPMDRIPAYIRRAVYEEDTNHFVGQYWCPGEPYVWQHEAPKIEGAPRIYEAHVGMAIEDQRVGSFNEFTDNVLPRIAKAGYNVVQLMAIPEHPYYGSFGYHVSSFFAVASRFGTPEEFKRLIDTAHGMGILVLLDLVHSHAVKNYHEGLNRFDGTDYQYFHSGPRGEHDAWDSLLFDYSKWEVQRFLLSNVRFWLEEFHVDGFRFDGVTSMMYLHHGMGHGFSSYDDYLIHELDVDAICYLQLANQVAHSINPNAITIAEDVSGMVGLGRSLEEGGLGFDYRLAMGIPDYWIKLLKHQSDEDWNMDALYHTLTDRRHSEKHIAYAESHDQAMVGDKTIAFWLMDAEMYWRMSKADETNPIIDRGIALHKMIRLITFALGGDGYLNFIGNEFGHPEWIDFPREGNGFSYKYARRQWSLVDDPMLRFTDLAAFDREMQGLDEKFGLLSDPLIQLIHLSNEDKIIIFRRGQLVFAFNFHPNQSFADYRIGVPDPMDYEMILNTDDLWFGGHSIVPNGQQYPKQSTSWHGRTQSAQIYLPSRTAQVLAPRLKWVP